MYSNAQDRISSGQPDADLVRIRTCVDKSWGQVMRQTSNSIVSQLRSAVDPQRITTDPDRLAAYSQDQSFTPRRHPHCVVFPESTDEVQGIIKLANEHRVPVVPRSSAVSLHGASIPTEGGIVIDLGRMKQILDVDTRNWQATIEPGVTFSQLQAELRRHGLRAAAPLLDPPSASVVSTYMERNPAVTAADFVYGAEHVISYTLVAPTGELFTVGHPPLKNTPASAPDGPGLNFYRLFQGAQGSLGVVTWMVIRVLPIPLASKAFFVPCSDVKRAAEVISSIQARELGLECFALNRFNLAAMLTDHAGTDTKQLQDGLYIGPHGAPLWAKPQLQQFFSLRNALPPWTVVTRLCGVGPLPEEKVAYQELDLNDAIALVGAKLETTVAGISDCAEVIQQELSRPWRMQKRFGFRGTCHSLMFYASPERVVEFADTTFDAAQPSLYPKEDMGGYLLPIERGRAFYCCYDLHCSRDDQQESARVSQLFDDLSETLVYRGAFFDRPYGSWAEKVYRRAGTYTEYLKKIKHTLDPNRIMNPGKLCL